MSDTLNNGQRVSRDKNLLNRIAAGILRINQPIFRWINSNQFHDYLYHLVLEKMKWLSPKDNLQMLFNLENALYHLQSQAAIDYDGGVHTKLRHTQYPKFFTNRIKAEYSVLDVGCGYGAVAFEIAEQTGAQVVGLDIDEEKIQSAKKRYPHPNLEFFVGDALAFGEDHQCQIVVLSNVLEHLPDRSQFLHRLIRSSSASIILVRVPVYERDWRVPLKKEVGVEWRLDHTHETEYTLESFQEEIDSAGLKISHLEVRWGEIWAELIPDGT